MKKMMVAEKFQQERSPFTLKNGPIHHSMLDVQSSMFDVQLFVYYSFSLVHYSIKPTPNLDVVSPVG